MAYNITCIIGDDTIELDKMDKNTTVSNLSISIQRKCGIPPNRQQIFHDNGDVDTTQPTVTLNELNIPNNCRFIVLDSNPSAPLQMIPNIDYANIDTDQQTNSNVSLFDEWLYNNRLTDIKHLLSKHGIYSMDKLSTRSHQFRNLMCDINILISRCHNMIPKLLTAINNNPKVISLEEGTCPFSGQFQYKTICLECNEQKSKTDSFLFLTLPIPRYKIVEYTFMDFDHPNNKPIVYGAILLKTADITTMKQVIAKDRCLTQIPFTFLKHLDCKIIFPVFGYIRNLCDKLTMKLLPDLILYICVSFYYDSAENEIYICDVWKSKFHRELRKADAIDDINRKSDDIFVYRSRIQNICQWKHYNKPLKHQTFVIYHQHDVLARQGYLPPPQPMFEMEEIGFPLLITLPMNVPVTMKQVYIRIWKIAKPYFKDQKLIMDCNNKPFSFVESWGFNNSNRIEIQLSNEICDIAERKNVKFFIHWKDAKNYDGSRFTARIRDKSAPNPVDNRNNYSSGCMKQNKIDLDKILEMYFKDESVDSCCTENGSSTRVRELLLCPDLLVVHLQRFTDDKNENIKEVSNTLVKLPLDGLNLMKYLVLENNMYGNFNDMIYDCYAISNHNHQWNVNTGYVRNRDDNKWYYLDKNGNVSKVINVDHMMTSEAYIAYYLKRNSKKK
eukprot:491787_1